jgi:hypothetical protein
MSKLLSKAIAAVAIVLFWCITTIGSTIATTLGTTIGATTLATAVTAATSTPAEARRRWRRRRYYRRSWWGPRIYFGWGGYPRYRRGYWW